MVIRSHGVFAAVGRLAARYRPTPSVRTSAPVWGASIICMAEMAMNATDYSHAWKEFSVRGWRKNEPGELGSPEKPVLLKRAMQVALDAGVSFTDLVHRAGLPESDIQTILDDNEDSRPRVEL